MNDPVRKRIIAGNWKMYKTVTEAEDFVARLLPSLPSSQHIDTVICAPALALERVVSATAGTALYIGAQNMHWEAEGAYTGEISPYQLKHLGVQYVIIGHSERRELFAETNETVNKKVRAAFQYGLQPIVCVGETWQEREAGQTHDVIKTAIVQAFAGLQSSEVSQAVIAYEPIWAIGSGQSATPEEANAVSEWIRTIISEHYSNEVAKLVRIQYGGSVNEENSRAFFQQPHIDGALVGGASLNVDSFLSILEAAQHE